MNEDKEEIAKKFNVNPDLFESSEEIIKFAWWFTYLKQ